MTPEIQRLDVRAQLQHKLAERATKDKEIAELQHQERLFPMSSTRAASGSSLGNYLWLFVIIAMLVGGFLAQNGHYLGR